MSARKICKTQHDKLNEKIKLLSLQIYERIIAQHYDTFQLLSKNKTRQLEFVKEIKHYSKMTASYFYTDNPE